MIIDPVCLFHGLKHSEHVCLYCSHCFNTSLSIEDFWQDENGDRWDICMECFEAENKRTL